MRPSAPFRQFVASALFVFYAAFAVLSGALVRCQEADGSTSIEWRGAGCCSPLAPTDHAPDAETREASDEDCGGCQDESLSETSSATRVRHVALAAVQNPDAPAALPALAAAVQSLFVVSPGLRSGQMRAPHPPPRLAAIRSTVIRC